jgi:hypothetical protein
MLIFCRRPGASIYTPQFTPGKPYRMKSRADRGSVYRSPSNGDQSPIEARAP